MRWQLIIKEFGHNIQHIAVVDNIVADTLILFPFTSVNKYYPSTSKAQCYANELFAIGTE